MGDIDTEELTIRCAACGHVHSIDVLRPADCVRWACCKCLALNVTLSSQVGSYPDSIEPRSVEDIYKQQKRGSE